VGREVAVKTIQPLWANHPEFLRRFEVEAQLVARLEHPHIVPLYDYWRDPSGAYLVMRWMRGGTLNNRLADCVFTLGETGRLLSQIGPALAAAHRSGVVHGDLKPTNVLFDEEGNSYLSDFGIAIGFYGGTDPHDLPAGYSINGEAPCVRGDVGALGLLLYQCLSGVDARQTTVRASVPGEPASLLPATIGEPDEIPQQIADVLHRATAVDPDDRYTDVNEFMSVWESAFGDTDAEIDYGLRSDARNPYKGLRPFGEPDADDFYGRKRLIAQLADAVEAHSIVTAIGPSGIGKSSVVKAGLLPALRRGVVPGSDEWLITTMTPGRDAFGELAAALTHVSVFPAVDLQETLRSGPLSLVDSARRLLPPDTPLLLVIDQFEELFTLVDNEHDRRAFLDLLMGTAAAEDGMIRIVLTMRADFMDWPLRYARFGDLFRKGVVLISTPRNTELRAIVEEPARAVGVRFESGLVDRIVNDVEDQPGGLPLLEFCLAELFDQRDADLLTLSAYEEAGGVPGTIGRRAEDLYHDLDRVSKETARQLFLRLVTVSETGRDTRRRVSVTELHRLGISADAVAMVLDAFGRYRILTFDRDPVTRTPTVEVAHEAVLSEWKRFESWIEDHRDDLLLHRRLTAAISEWEDSDHDSAYLPSGGRLEGFESWVADTDMVITSVEQGFLVASRTRDNEQRTKRTRRRTWILVGFAGAAVIALILAVAALYQSSLRASEAAVNHARELSAGAMGNLDTDPELSMLLALEAMSVTPEPQREAVEALHAAVLASRSEFLMPWPDDLPPGRLSVATTPDGIVAFTSDGWTIVLHDGDTGELVGRLVPDSGVPVEQDGLVSTISANPGTGEIAAVHADRTLRVWDPMTGTVAWSGFVGVDPSRDGLSPVEGRAFYSPDGRWIAAVVLDTPPVIGVWDAATGEQLWIQDLVDLAPSVSASFSPSGDELAIAWWRTPGSGFGGIAVLDRSTGTELRRVDLDTPVGSVAWSPDGSHIFHGTEAGALVVRDADSLEQSAVRSEHRSSLDDITFSRDGTLLATRGAGGTIIVWTPDPLDPIVSPTRSGGGGSIAFSPDGARLFSGRHDGTVQAWDVGPEGLGEWMAAAATGAIFGLDVDAAGTNLIAHSAAGRFTPAGITVWDADTGDLDYDMDGMSDFPFGGVIYLSDGDRFAAQRVDDTGTEEVTYDLLQVRDAEDGEILVDMEGSSGFDRQQLSTSLDGRYLASGGTGDLPGEVGSASIYDPASGTLLGRLPHPDWAVTGTAFSPDGSLLATGTCLNGFLRIWDWRSETMLQEVPRGQCITRVAFSPAARIVAVSGFGTPTLVWDVDAGLEMYALGGSADDAHSVAFSPDGERIATAGLDGTIRIWDAGDGSELLTIPISAVALGDVAFFPDGDRIAAASIDGNLWVVALDTDDLVHIAQDRLTRTFTADECTRYHIDSCPTD
jgi:WD40 repeat protein